MDSIDQEIFRNKKLEIDSLPKFEEVELYRFSSNYVIKLHASTTIGLLICAAMLAGAYYFFFQFRAYAVWVAIFLVLMFAWSYFTNFQLQKRNGYAVRERDIIYKRGYLFEKYTVVPFNRMQHVSTNRGVLDKFLNLSTLKIFTAGGSGSDVSLSGLTPETANSLKEALSDRMAGHV